MAQDAAVADASLANDALPGPDAAAADAARPDAADTPVLTFEYTVDTAQEGGGGGDPFNDPCPQGQVLTGFSGANDGGDRYVGQLSGHCSNAALIPDGGGGFTIALSVGEQLPARGVGGGTAWTRECNDGDVVVGFDGRAGSLIDRLFVRCATLSVTGTLGSLSFQTSGTYELPRVGGDGGNTFPHRDCPADEVATIARGRAGDLIDALALGCAAPIAN